MISRSSRELYGVNGRNVVEIYLNKYVEYIYTHRIEWSTWAWTHEAAENKVTRLSKQQGRCLACFQLSDTRCKYFNAPRTSISILTTICNDENNHWAYTTKPSEKSGGSECVNEWTEILAGFQLSHLEYLWFFVWRSQVFDSIIWIEPQWRQSAPLEMFAMFYHFECPLFEFLRDREWKS